MAKDFALVSVRDSASARALRAHGVNCRVVPDLSLYAGSWSSDTPRRSTILFSDSVEPTKALALDRARQACNGEPISIIHSNPGMTDYLRFIRGPIAKADLFYPMRVLRMARMRQCLHEVSSPNTGHFMQRLATGSLLVSGRFHACTLALCTGTPFISVSSNTGKITALIQDAGLDLWRAQTPLDCLSLRQAQARGWSTGEASSLTSYVASAKTAADALFADIRSLV
jgi:polysaccharide pyruvyl transferase WcaK-like protein